MSRKVRRSPFSVSLDPDLSDTLSMTDLSICRNNTYMQLISELQAATGTTLLDRPNGVPSPTVTWQSVVSCEYSFGGKPYC